MSFSKITPCQNYRKVWETYCHPQSEFISDEEKREFQGIYADGTNCLYLCQLVKALNEMRL